MDNTVLALKTMMVFLNSWNMTTDIVFDNLIINWFESGRNKFNVLFEGKKIGEIGFEGTVIPKLYFSSLRTFYRKFYAVIEVNKNPLALDFNIEIDSLTEDATINGNFEIKQDEDGLFYSTVDCQKTKHKSEFTKSMVKTNFTLACDSLFSCSIEDMYGTEQLNLADTSISYSYASKDEEHPISFLAKVNTEENKIAGISAKRLVTQKSFKYEDVTSDDIKYHPYNLTKLDTNTMKNLMAELNPNFQRTIKKVADCLEDNFPYYYWFYHLLDLSFSTYQVEDIINLFGLSPKHVNLDGTYKDLNEVFTTTKVKSLVRSKNVKK